MLLTFQGYFKAGQFVADTPIQIPEERKTIVTVLDEKINRENENKQYIAYWNKIIKDIQNSDEVLEGTPDRIRFKTPETISAL